MKPCVVIKGLTFKYPSASTPALSDVDLEIDRGNRIILVSRPLPPQDAVKGNTDPWHTVSREMLAAGKFRMTYIAEDELLAGSTSLGSI